MRPVFHPPWRVFVALLLTILLWGAWLVNTRGFGDKWRQYINQEFRKRGFEVVIERLTLDPFRGLVARNVKIYPYQDATRPSGEIGEVALDIDYTRLFQGKEFLNAIDLRRTALTIPVSDDEEPLVIKGLSARVSLPENEVVVRELQADVLGLRILAEGRVDTTPELPDHGKSLEDKLEEEEEREKDAQDQKANVAKWWPMLRSELERYQVDGKPITLKLSVAGEWARPETMNVTVELAGQRFRRGDVAMDMLHVQAVYAGKKLTVKAAELEAGGGRIRGGGALTLDEAPRGSFQLAGQLNPLPFLHPLMAPNSPARSIHLETPPELALSGSIHQGEAGLVTELVGRLACDNPVFREQMFRRLEADFAVQGTRWMVQGLRISHDSGQLKGAMRVLPEDVRAEMVSTLSAPALAALFGEPVEQLLERMEIVGSPEITVSARGDALIPAEMVSRGFIELPRFRYNGVWFSSGSSQFSHRAAGTTLDKVVLRRDEGKATGKVRLLPGGHLELERVSSTINYVDGIKALGPTLERVLTPYRIRGAPRVDVNGTVQLVRGGTSDLKIEIDAREGMDLAMFGKELPVDEAEAQVGYRNGHLTIDGLTARVYGGSAALDLSLNVRGGSDLLGKLAVDGVDYNALSALYFNNTRPEGKLTGQLDFRAPSLARDQLVGEGQALVVSQNIFNMSFLGPLSGLLENTIGFGASKTRELEAVYRLGGGKVIGEKLELRSAGYSLIGAGSYDYINSALDADVRVNMRGGPGLLLYPVSKLLEFTAGGTLAQPNWRAKNFTRAPRPAVIPRAEPVEPINHVYRPKPAATPSSR